MQHLILVSLSFKHIGCEWRDSDKDWFVNTISVAPDICKADSGVKSEEDNERHREVCDYFPCDARVVSSVNGIALSVFQSKGGDYPHRQIENK